VVVVTVHVTTVEKQVTSHVSVLPRWEEAEVEAAVNGQTQESVTIAMEVDIYRVTVLSREKALTEAAWSATSVTRWVTSLVTALIPAVVLGDHHAMVASAVVVVVEVEVAQMFAVTTVTRWGTSRATVQLLHRKLANLWQFGDKSGWLILRVERERT
jgi:hypothetical protein